MVLSTIKHSGVCLLLAVSACHGYPLLEDLPVGGGNGLDARYPSLHIVTNDALLQSKYNLPVMNIALSPPTLEYQPSLVQHFMPPVHNFQRMPVTELRPPTLAFQPPVVKFNWKKRVDVFPGDSSPLKVTKGRKGAATKTMTSTIEGVDTPTPWWVSVPIVNRHLLPPTENFDISG